MRHTITGVTLALAASSLFPIGAGGQRGLCGTRSTAACTAPGFVFQKVSAGFAHSCAVEQDGKVACWGDGRKGALGSGQQAISRLPQRVSSAEAFIDVAAGGDYSCARTAQGRVFCWGSERVVPGWPEVGTVPREVALPRPAAALSAGRRHACVLDDEGVAWCWGWNVDGETGTGTSGISSAMVATPTRVESTATYSSLSAGLGFTCGVTTDARVHCWGSNVDRIIGPRVFDRCGDVHPIPCATRPTEVAMPAPIKQVATGSTHACALTAEGKVFCWGANGSGQVGAHGPGVPVLLSPLEVVIPRSGEFTAITSGGTNSCALTRSRRVYCWGAYDHASQFLADEDALAPSLTAGGTQFMAVSAGQGHACGLDTRGRVLCWGDTILGALGIR
jgi:alpha-tubulin suppressor-like RCC1 family protein